MRRISVRTVTAAAAVAAAASSPSTTAASPSTALVSAILPLPGASVGLRR